MPMPITSAASMAKCKTQAGMPSTCASARSNVGGQWQRPAATRLTPAVERPSCNARRGDKRAPEAPSHRLVHPSATVGRSGRPRARARDAAAVAPVAQVQRPLMLRQRGAAMLHSIERLPWSHQPCRPYPPRRPAASPATASAASRKAASRQSSRPAAARPAWATSTAVALTRRPPPAQTDIGAASSGRDRGDWPRD